MRARIQKWGNSLALRIPRAFAVEVGLAQDAEVEISAIEGRLVVVPVRRARFDLAELVERVTPANVHGEVATAPPVGKETW